MKKSLLFIIISMAFLFTGVDAFAQDTKHADPRYLELDEHPTFKGGGPNNFATWVTSHVKYPKAAKKAGVEGTVKVCFVVDTEWCRCWNTCRAFVLGYHNRNDSRQPHTGFRRW